MAAFIRVIDGLNGWKSSVIPASHISDTIKVFQRPCGSLEKLLSSFSCPYVLLETS
jgi:hypothetical protein